MNGKTWEKVTVAKRLDGRSYLVATEDASYRRNRVDLQKTHEMGQPDTYSIQKRDVNSENDYQEPTGQPSPMPPSKKQKSHSA